MREACFNIFIGTNGVGKTMQQKKFLKLNKRNLILPANKLDKAWDEVSELKVLDKWVNDPNDYRGKRMQKEYYAKGLNTYKGSRKMYFDTDKKLMRKQFQDIVSNPENGFFNGGLFMDDYKNYLPSNGQIPSYFRQIFNDRRHRMLDIFMASHSLQDINAELLQFNPTIFLFKTTRPPNKSVLDKIANSKELISAYNRINKIATVGKSNNDKYYFEPFKPLM